MSNKNNMNGHCSSSSRSTTSTTTHSLWSSITPPPPLHKRSSTSSPSPTSSSFLSTFSMNWSGGNVSGGNVSGGNVSGGGLSGGTATPSTISPNTTISPTTPTPSTTTTTTWIFQQPNHNNLLIQPLLSFFRHYIYSDDQTKHLFYFILVNILFMIIELVFGIYNNSLGLISDSAHMFFDCTALVIGLYGSIMSKWKSNQIYSYGYVRYEYLSGFINGILLVFISIYILLESIHRLIDPPIVHTQQLLLVSVMGFAVNMYGVIFYHQDHYGCNGHSHNSSHCSSYSHNNSSTTTLHEESSSCENEMNHNERQTMNSSSPSSTTTHSEQHFECSHHHHDENLYGVYLHMIADALGSIGVITSTLIVQYLGWYIADPICSLIISVMILYTSIPLITNSSRVLLQRTPIQHEHKINECVKEVLQLEGVVQVRNLHFWVLKSNLNVGSCKVLISNQSNEQTILKQVTNIFRNYRCNLDMTIEVEKDPLQVMAHSEHSHHE